MQYWLAIRARLSFIAAAWLGTVLVLALLCAGPVWADIHPVPLEKNADSAKCLECHADKAKGKSVHTAISTGCTTCHEIRVSRDVTRVKLITTTPYALCLTCHADENAADIKGIVHRPAVRDCLKRQWLQFADNAVGKFGLRIGENNEIRVIEIGTNYSGYDAQSKNDNERSGWQGWPRNKFGCEPKCLKQTLREIHRGE
jgi:predicted CXXCH cytochrome family protein